MLLSEILEYKTNILSTALLPQNAAQQLLNHNIFCDEIPFIKTTEAVSTSISWKIKTLAEQKKVIIFTSAQAIVAVVNVLENQIPDWQIFCISGATKTAAVKYFGAEKILGFADDALDLVKEIEQMELQEIVFFCGNKRLDTLPEMLADKGYKLTEYVVYETLLTPVKIEKVYGALLFFSPSGIESFLIDNVIPEAAVLFSIGKTTAKSLQEKVKNEVVISAKPDKNILVQTVIDFYNKKKI